MSIIRRMRDNGWRRGHDEIEARIRAEKELTTQQIREQVIANERGQDRADG